MYRKGVVANWLEGGKTDFLSAGSINRKREFYFREKSNKYTNHLLSRNQLFIKRDLGKTIFGIGDYWVKKAFCNMQKAFCTSELVSQNFSLPQLLLCFYISLLHLLHSK